MPIKHLYATLTTLSQQQTVAGSTVFGSTFLASAMGWLPSVLQYTSMTLGIIWFGLLIFKYIHRKEWRKDG